MIKVSIIIPLHNGEAFIEETLTSCLNQDQEHLEIIVVENGSKDKSYEVASKIKDDRLKLFKIDLPNAAAARNYGFLQSKGEYITFLDADDILGSNKIELQLSVLQNKPAGWVASCAWAKFNEKVEEAQVKTQRVWKVHEPIDWMVSHLTGGGMMIPGCWLIPRSVIEKAGLWNESLSLHDDGEFICRVLLASKGNIFTRNTLVYYRQVENSLSRQNFNLAAAKSALKVYKSYTTNLLAVKDNLIIRRALAHNYRNFIYQFYPNFKALIKEAKHEITNLNVKPVPSVGGENFKKLANIVGFNNALRLRVIGRSISKF